eukprot:1159580-Pelagomonas_calceolata.AAC.1
MLTCLMLAFSWHSTSLPLASSISPVAAIVSTLLPLEQPPRPPLPTDTAATYATPYAAAHAAAHALLRAPPHKACVAAAHALAHAVQALELGVPMEPAWAQRAHAHAVQVLELGVPMEPAWAQVCVCCVLAHAVLVLELGVPMEPAWAQACPWSLHGHSAGGLQQTFAEALAGIGPALSFARTGEEKEKKCCAFCSLQVVPPQLLQIVLAAAMRVCPALIDPTQLPEPDSSFHSEGVCSSGSSTPKSSSSDRSSGTQAVRGDTRDSLCSPASAANSGEEKEEAGRLKRVAEQKREAGRVVGPESGQGSEKQVRVCGLMGAAYGMGCIVCQLVPKHELKWAEGAGVLVYVRDG